MKTLLRTIGSAACLAAALALSNSAQANLLVDPGFEAAAFGQPNPVPVPGGVGGGWAAFGATITVAAAHAGSQSVQIADNGWNPQGLYQMLPAAAGQTYDFSAWMMSPNPTANGWGAGTPALVQISFFDSTGTGIAGAAFGPWQSIGPANTWVQSAVVEATAPAGTAYVGAYLMMMDNNGANGFNFYFDDASLTLVPEPSSLALLGLGLVSAVIWRRRQ